MNNSSSNGSTGPNCPSIVYAVDRGVLYVCAVVVFLVVIFGLFGNVLSYLVLRYSRSNSANVYLRCLSVADCLSLLFAVSYTSGTMIYRPLLGEESHLARLSQTWYLCQILMYLSFTTRMISIYIIVVFTIERLATVVRPLFGSAFFTPKKARLSVGAVVVVSIVFNIPMLFAMSRHPTKRLCMVNDVFFNMKTVVYIVITMLPCIVVGFCNVFIGILMRRRQKARAAMLSNALATKRTKKQSRLVVQRLMLVSISFFTLSLPYFIYATYADIRRYIYKASCAERTSTPMANVLTICLTLFFCNFGINFALYCLTGRQFRLAVRALLRCDHETLKQLTLYMHENAQTPAATPYNTSRTDGRYNTSTA